MISNQEAERLSALERYEVLDTPVEESFDRLTRLATAALDVPIALVSLVDETRQWFKSRQGLDAPQTSRGISFCTYAIQEDGPFIVPDTLNDERFASNPLVLGDPNIRFYAGIPLQTPDGFKLGTLCVIDRKPRLFSAAQIEVLYDLARLVVDQLEFRRVAETDCLTGVFTRKKALNFLRREIELAKRDKKPLAIAVMDVDHFKAVNDTYGHPVGDRVLRDLVERIRSALGKNDFIGRLGGEEFMIVMPNNEISKATMKAERVRSSLNERKISLREADISVTASFGLAALNKYDEIADLMKRADEATYLAKNNGRNCVVASSLQIGSKHAA